MSEFETTETPAGWLIAELSNLVAVNYGKALSGSNRSSTGTIPVVGSSGIVGSHDAPLVNGPCIVVGRKGAAGAVHLVRQSCWPIDTAYYIQPPAGIRIEYLNYLLGLLQLVQLDKSTAIPSLSRDDLYRVKIPLAPTAEQTRIVEKLEELLSDLDDGVNELKAAQKKLGQYRQSLLKAAVEGELSADWRSKNKVKETGAQLLQRILKERRTRWETKQLAKYKDQNKTPPTDWKKKYPEPVKPDITDLPKLPDGWVWASLDMLGEIASGVAKGTKRDENVKVREVPYLRVANVQRGYLNLTEVKTIYATERDIAELTLQSGDVLFNEGGDRDKLGRGWVWSDEVSNCIHQNHVFRMRPYLPEVLPELLSHHGNTFGKLWFKTAGKQTTNLASINMSMLRMFPVPLGPAKELQEIQLLLQLQMDTLDRQEQAVLLGLKQSAAQRKNILKAAFTGQLVPQNPNDEPASILLERIRTERTMKVAPAKKPAIKKSEGKANRVARM